MDEKLYLRLLEEARDERLLRPTKAKKPNKHAAIKRKPTVPTLEKLLQKQSVPVEDRYASNLAALTKRHTSLSAMDFLLKKHKTS